MGLWHRHLDPKFRRLVAAANVCLAVGLSLWFFTTPTGVWRIWIHAFCGLLFGYSITVNLCALYSRRRCSQKQI